MKTNFRKLIAAAAISLSFAATFAPRAAFAQDACRILLQGSDIQVAIARGAEKDYVVNLLKKSGVPAMQKATTRGPIPVILLNGKTQAAVAELLNNSMGTIVAQQPGYGNDHGEMRVGQFIIDVDTPGARGYGELNRTGLSWKPLKSYLDRKLGNEEGYYNWIEVGYLLTPVEQKVANVYQTMRRAAVIRVPFTFGGNKPDMTLPNMLSAAEHCFIFCKASAIDSHIGEMTRKLQLAGIRDVAAFMKTSQVQAYYKAASDRLVSFNADTKLLNNSSVNGPDLEAILAPVLPANVVGVERQVLINWIFGLSATTEYQSLRNSLGMTTDLTWRDINAAKRASFVLVYGKTTDAAAFRSGTFESPGVFNSWTKEQQAPLP